MSSGAYSRLFLHHVKSHILQLATKPIVWKRVEMGHDQCLYFVSPACRWGKVRQFSRKQANARVGLIYKLLVPFPKTTCLDHFWHSANFCNLVMSRTSPPEPRRYWTHSLRRTCPLSRPSMQKLVFLCGQPPSLPRVHLVRMCDILWFKARLYFFWQTAVACQLHWFEFVWFVQVSSQSACSLCCSKCEIYKTVSSFDKSFNMPSLSFWYIRFPASRRLYLVKPLRVTFGSGFFRTTPRWSMFCSRWRKHMDSRFIHFSRGLGHVASRSWELRVMVAHNLKMTIWSWSIFSRSQSTRWVIKISFFNGVRNTDVPLTKGRGVLMNSVMMNLSDFEEISDLWI